MDWLEMNKMQKMMVVDDFFRESFSVEDAEQINSFIRKRDEDTDGGYTEQLKCVDKIVAGYWRADLKNALRELDDMTDWKGDCMANDNIPEGWDDPGNESEACGICGRMPINPWDGECMNCGTWEQPCPSCASIYDPEKGCAECGFGTEDVE